MVKLVEKMGFLDEKKKKIKKMVVKVVTGQGKEAQLVGCFWLAVSVF